MGEQAGDGGAAGVVGTEDLSQEDPEQEWSALKTCPRKTQSVTSGEKIRSNQPPRAASACSRRSSVRTLVNGKSPS
jgi:hypothetical protein